MFKICLISNKSLKNLKIELTKNYLLLTVPIMPNSALQIVFPVFPYIRSKKDNK